MSDADIAALYAFFMTRQPVQSRPPDNELPEYLRGWGFTTFEGSTTPPQLLNLTELLLVNVTPDGAQLVDHEWGGDGGGWTGYKPPADIKSIPDQQLKQLQPLFAALLQQQGGSLLTHLQLAH